MLVAGLFDGEHVFELEEMAGGGTRVIQSEYFRGVTVPFLGGWLNESIRPDFVAMNNALRDRSEHLAHDGLPIAVRGAE